VGPVEPGVFDMGRGRSASNGLERFRVRGDRRRRSWCGRRARRFCRCRLGLGVDLANRYLERHDELTFRHFVADLHVQCLHGAGPRRWYLHRRFVGFQRDQRVVDQHFVAGLHEQFDDFHTIEITDVGDLNVIAAQRRRRVPGAHRWGDIARAVLIGGDVDGLAGFEQGNDVAFGELVAELNFQITDRAGRGRRYFHRGFVRFQRNQRIFRGDRVAGRHQDLDDFDVAEIAYVGNANFL
jgi:hypothetical protein